MSYTKGPWSWIPSQREDAQAEFQVISGNELICDIVPCLFPEEIEKGKANARLIASAPELLEACKEAFEELVKVCTKAGYPDNKTKAQKLIEQAIAKARANNMNNKEYPLCPHCKTPTIGRVYTIARKEECLFCTNEDCYFIIPVKDLVEKKLDF